MVIRHICAGVLVMLAVPGQVLAQRPQNLAPGECTNCHDHDKQKEWSLTRDGDGKGKQHFKAYQQLFEPKGAEYADALGLAKANDPKGTCLTCHATVVQGRAKNGVTCQSCHGPGSAYFKPHQSKGAYQASLPLGMKDVVKNPKMWVEDCLRCHVMGANGDADAKIVKAGHPDGSDFTVGSRLQFVSGPGHWNSKYTPNEINALGEPIRLNLLARLKKGGAANAGASTVVEKPPDAPPPSPLPPPPAVGENPARGGGSPPPPETARGVPQPTLPPETRDRPEPTVTVPRPGLIDPVVPPVRPPRASRPPTPPAAPADAPAPAASVPAAPVPAMDAPMTAAAVVGAVQGRLAALLDTLLARGVTLPKPITPPQRPTLYRGADAELIRLQEEIIALALEALASAPAKATPPR